MKKNIHRFTKPAILIALTLNVVLGDGPFLLRAQDFYNYKSTSLLATGLWYKLGVIDDGVYVVKGQDLVQWGVPALGKPLASFRLFGHGGLMLFERSDSTPVDDVQEVPLWVVDVNGNGLMDAEDGLFFFGKGPLDWRYDNSCLRYSHQTHLYSDTAYYFLNFGEPVEGLRLSMAEEALGSPDTVVAAREHLVLIEKDSVNLIRSGRQWFWRRFDVLSQHQFTLNIPHLTGKPLSVRSAVAERCLTSPGQMVLRVNGVQVLQHTPPLVSDHYEAPLASWEARCGTASLASEQIVLQMVKVDNTCETAWLDFIELKVERYNVKEEGSQLFLMHSETVGKNRVDYQLNGALSGVKVWEVTQPSRPVEWPLNGSVVRTFGGQVPRRFVAFKPEEALRPHFFGRIENQNLHALPSPDLIIISPPDFQEEAKRLADFRQAHDGLEAIVVTPQQIYNEFSHGQQDITAIRNFLQMFYLRGLQGQKMPRYVLLFGDASYDYKTHLNRTYRMEGSKMVNINTNFVPTYQSTNSLSRNGLSFGSDEFYAFLRPGTGLHETMVYGPAQQDIAIGRLTVRNREEAAKVVDKLIRYSSSPACLKPWRNEVLFVADDMDEPWENIFVYTSEDMSGILKNEFPVWNRAKIYLDAYRQVISSGQRYPDAQRELDLRMKLGTLFISYVGHGGETGWASERLLGMAQIDALTNAHALPLYYTATCTFTRFDDPHLRSGGERLIEMDQGGAIGLISTTRSTTVIGSFNKNIIRNMMSYTSQTDMPRLGDILRKSKNQYGGTYPLMLLFGDPSQRLAYPEHVVRATNITVDGQETDTMKATSLVTVKGVIENRDGQLLSDFNGRIYFTQFDKPGQTTTLQNDPQAQKIPFEVERNIVFRGQGLVQNGHWSVTFKVPIDIQYTVGKAKMSLYAENGFTDAHGYQEFYIGGSAGNCPNQQGPEVQLFLNDSLYQEGDVAGTNLAVYVRLSDSDGINTTGAGIGHDLMAVLEGPENKTYILNEFFNYFPGSYTDGEARLPLGPLPDGTYTLRVVAWDNCNNPGDAWLAFRLDNSRLILNNLTAFPNPASDQVTISFSHNLAGHTLEAELRVFDLQGRLVYQHRQPILNSGYRSLDIRWDCTAQGGYKLAPGVYPYSVTLRDEQGRTARAGSKLVIF
ncbi:MAG: type IX secretion system sortase PorU [Flavobacteriales bacterium]|nr:type IX secretion system sortase PorU [Flavobacteriales bacterium]MCX7767880.1 type IX secretion system sortase PorU [Flavobacteriales bacterium]MDW8409284.1 type IX secretion system sortase PorU [Flavobacteriales bacterium]